MQRLPCRRGIARQDAGLFDGETVRRRSVKRDSGKRAPGWFDALELARTSGIISGEVDPGKLSRIADRLAPSAGSLPVRITWRIDGGHDAMRRPALTVSVEGEVRLICQRCLRPVAVSISQRTMLLLAPSELDLAVLDEAEPEVVLANAPVDPLGLVEDELLLSLPFSPRHDENECAAAVATQSGRAVQSPFAGLAQLKARQGSRN